MERKCKWKDGGRLKRAFKPWLTWDIDHHANQVQVKTVMILQQNNFDLWLRSSVVRVGNAVLWQSEMEIRFQDTNLNKIKERDSYSLCIPEQHKKHSRQCWCIHQHATGVMTEVLTPHDDRDEMVHGTVLLQLQNCVSSMISVAPTSVSTSTCWAVIVLDSSINGM